MEENSLQILISFLPNPLSLKVSNEVPNSFIIFQKDMETCISSLNSIEIIDTNKLSLPLINEIFSLMDMYFYYCKELKVS